MLSSILIFLFVLTCGKSTIIESKQQRHFTLQVGAALQEKIPIVFRNFQHSLIKEVKSKTDQQPQTLCEIRLAEVGILRLVNAISYNLTGPTEQQIDDQIVYDLNTLRSLKIFVDAVYFQQKIIALFQNNEVIIYSVNLENGRMSQDTIVTMTDVGSLNDAKLTIFGERCYIVSHESIGYIRDNGEYDFYVNLTTTQYIIGEAIEMKNLLLAPAGGSGLITYSYHPETSSFDQMHRTTFQFKDNFLQADFSVNEVFLDRYSKQIYILDHKQGLLQTSVSAMQQNNRVTVKDRKLLMGGCYNLIVTAFHIYLTCPELLQIARDTLAVSKIISISFFAYEVRYSNQRLFLFGRRQFAIFDIFGGLVEEHVLSVHSQKSFDMGNYLVTFTNSQVVSNSIIAQREKLYCHTNAVEKEGQYSGVYQSSGLCKEYYPTQFNTTDICLVEYPFTLSVTNSAPVSYVWEVVLLAVWIGLMVVGISYCTIRYLLIHRGYNLTLVQEDTLYGLEGHKKERELQKVGAAE